MQSTWNSFETLERVFTHTFGPNGVAALIQGPTGNMSITRSGWKIVQSIYEEQKLKNLPMKVMFKNIKTIHKTLGDGVKLFVLIEINFIQKLSQIKIETKMTSSKIHLELQSLLKAISDVHVSSSYPISVEKKEDRTKVTSALFYTSCPCIVSSHLESVFHNWVTLSLSDKQCNDSKQYIISRLEFLFKNFNLLCHGNNFGSRSVSDTYVLSGYLIEKIAINLNSSEEEQVEVELFSPDTEVDEMETLYRIKLLIQEKSSLTTLRILLLSTIFLSEGILFELKRQNIVVLHGVSTEDIEFISQLLYQNTPVARNIITIKSYVNGIKECTHLFMCNVFQLVVCAPTNSLICEYVHICKKALKHLINTAKSNKENSLVKAGGIFEKNLHFHIAKQSNRWRDPSFFFVRNRKELLHWHKQNQLLKSTLSDCLIETEVKELSLSNEFKNIDYSFLIGKEDQLGFQSSKRTNCSHLSDRNISQITDIQPSSANHYPDHLKIKNLQLQDISENILATFAQSLLVFNTLTSEHSEKEVFETVSYKMQLLQHIIATAILFFKCDIH